VAFSTSSILTKAASANPAESELVANIARDEQRLESLCRERGVPLALIRPTLIYGCGLDRNISSMARFGRRFGFIPVAGNSAGLRQPVHADDLSSLALGCLLSENPVILESVACGGSTLSYRKMMEKTAAVCGPGVRILALNTGMLKAAVRLVSVLPAYRGVNTEMVRRQAIDMIFDDTVLREKLGYQPRPFDPHPGDFDIPHCARELQLAG
jgi:nucleoside-diphosphate-sugar epimerase